MPTCALVSRTSDEQQGLLRTIGGDAWQFINCHDDRDALARYGAEVEVVYGNVREFEFAALPQLQFVQASWGGIENLLYPAMVNSDVIVANTRGAVATVMSEYIVGGLIYWTRAFDLHSKTTTWRTDRSQWGWSRLAKSTVMIFGAGTIAQTLLPRLLAMEMRVIAVTRSGQPVHGAARTITPDLVDEYLPMCQHLVILAPATPETQGFFSSAQFELMPPGGIIINASRGALIDEPALLAALDSGHLRGATLDVTDPEPPSADHAFFEHPKVLLTSHCAPNGGPMDLDPFDVFSSNFHAWCRNDRDSLQFVVDKAAGY